MGQTRLSTFKLYAAARLMFQRCAAAAGAAINATVPSSHLHNLVSRPTGSCLGAKCARPSGADVAAGRMARNLVRLQGTSWIRTRWNCQTP